MANAGKRVVLGQQRDPRPFRIPGRRLERRLHTVNADARLNTVRPHQLGQGGDRSVLLEPDFGQAVDLPAQGHQLGGECLDAVSDLPRRFVLRHHKAFPRKERVRSWVGAPMTWSGGPCSMMCPSLKKTAVSAT